MYNKDEIKQYNYKTKAKKLKGFIADKIEINDVYYLKVFNENESQSLLNRLIRMIKKRKFLMLFYIQIISR